MQDQVTSEAVMFQLFINILTSSFTKIFNLYTIIFYRIDNSDFLLGLLSTKAVKMFPLITRNTNLATLYEAYIVQYADKGQFENVAMWYYTSKRLCTAALHQFVLMTVPRFFFCLQK
jgi:hypothetical protein